VIHSNGEATGAKFNKIYTKFVFFGVSPDEALLGWCIVFRRAEGASVPTAKLDKTRPKLDAFKNVLVDEAAETRASGEKRGIPPGYCWRTG